MDDTELLISTVPQQEPQTDLGISLPGSAPEVLMTPNICVIGVGGAGGNAINNMIESKLNSVRFVVANTDAQVMANSLTHERIQLGAAITQGLGAGSNPQIGKAAAEESQEKIKEVLKGVNLLFIAAGMGGGTGTGASPVIAKIAREMGILTVAVVTKPFRMEGPKRMRIAEAGIEELTKYVDTILTIPNQNLFLISNAKTTIKEAFKMADNILYQAVKSITDLMVTTMDIQVDFADFCTITKNMGKAIMGSGEAEGENRALDATERAIVNPLLDVSIRGAKGVLVSVSGKDVGLWDAEAAAERIREEVDEDATIIFGTCTDESLGEKIRVSVVATGLNKNDSIIAPETQRSIQEVEKQEIIVPNNNPTEQTEDRTEEIQNVTGIFVPAGNSDNQSSKGSEEILLSDEIKSVQETVEDNFVPAQPVEIPLDENELENSVNDNTADLLAGVIEDLDKDITIQKQEVTKPEKVEEEKKTLWDFLPGFWSEKKMVEEGKRRLDPDKQPHLERQISPMPSEDILEIPAFLNESKT